MSERQPHYSGLILSLPQALRNQPSAISYQLSAEDGLLQVYEIFNLKLNAELVVLSACRTGLGKEVKGEGLIGLTRAFMYAGAPSMVASLWQVADRSTADLMVTFYQQLNQDRDKADALRQAKLKVIEAGRYAHPYYWSPFILVGEAK
jgi:CHAT domain-containing protein